MNTTTHDGEERQVFVALEGDTLVAYVLADDIASVSRFGVTHVEIVVSTRALTDDERAARAAASCADEFLDNVTF